MKLRLAIAILAPFLLAASPQPKQAQPIQKCADQTVKTLDRLTLEDNGQVYTVKKDEKQGIKDLRNIVYSVPLEGSWAYLPSKELWYGITEKAMKNTSKAYKGCSIELRKENRDITFYHTHDIDEEMLDQTRIFFGFVGDYFDCFREGIKHQMAGQAIYNTEGILLAIPSDDDLRKMMYKSIGHNLMHNDAKINHKIASAYGITEYYLTKQGSDYLGKLVYLLHQEIKGDKKRFWELLDEEVDPILKLSVNKMILSGIGIVPRDDMSIGEHVRKAVEAMSNNFFTVEFTPYRF